MKEFVKEFVELCKKHGLTFECEDPYCGFEIVPFTEEWEKYYLSLPDHMKEMMEDEEDS